MEIEQTDDGIKGLFYIRENNKRVAELFYHHTGNNIVIEHTEVEPALRNQGIAKKLVLKGVDYARENKLKIIPVCPFAKAILAGKPEYTDVLL